MASTYFINQTTIIDASWLNDANTVVYGLPDTTSATKGAGLIGYNSSITYPSNTVGAAIKSVANSLDPGVMSYNQTASYSQGSVGAELIKAQAQCKHLWRRIRTNQKDAYIMVVSDSTGNETTEWPYLMAQWLATQCPTHTIKYRLFSLGAQVGSGGTDTWGAYTTLQTGTGNNSTPSVVKTIYIDCAAVSGTNAFYFEGGREATVWGNNDYDLVIYNHGHNTGTTSTEDMVLPEFVSSLSNARLLAPRAGLLVTLQNPRTDAYSGDPNYGGNQTKHMCTAWRKAADLVGAGVIDVHSAFIATGANLSNYMADTVHPNALGQSALWLPEVKRVMAEPVTSTGDVPRIESPFSTQKLNYAVNPRFATWTAATPDSYTFTSCTPTKTTGVTESGLYSMQVTVGSGASPQFVADISSSLTRLRGRYVTLVARIYRPAGNTLDINAGRLFITATDGITPASIVSYPRGSSSDGGWTWAICSLFIPRYATSLTYGMFTGASTAGVDNGKYFYVDSIGLFESASPGAIGFETNASKFVSNYYADGNVGVITGETGTVTAVSGTITRTGATSPNCGVYINLPGLTVGQTYTLSFGSGSTCTGNTGGGIYVRSGFNGGSTTITSGTWSVGTAASLTFTATTASISLWIYGYTGATAFSIPSVVVASTSAITGNSLPILSMRNADGSSISGTGSGTNFGSVVSLGTNVYLRGANIVSTTITSVGWYEVSLPSNYSTGNPVTVSVNAQYAGAGTIGTTKTLTATAYRLDNTGTTGANIIATAAATLTATATDFIFTITGTTLSPNDRVAINLAAAVQESGGGTLYSRINSVRFSY